MLRFVLALALLIPAPISAPPFVLSVALNPPQPVAARGDDTFTVALAVTNTTPVTTTARLMTLTPAGIDGATPVDTLYLLILAPQATTVLTFTHRIADGVTFGTFDLWYGVASADYHAETSVQVGVGHRRWIPVYY
jgi:hypothetical protein